MIDMTKKFKYPKTYHLPWSLTVSKDDKRLKNTDQFQGKDVTVSVKKDGEQTSMYSDYMHARSLDSAHNFTRDWAKKLHSILKFDIPNGWIFTFENLAYLHSIPYDNLEGFCYLLNIWKEDGFCLSVEEVNEYAQLLDLPQPRVLYSGIYDEDVISKLHLDKNVLNLDKDEGYVIRVNESFHRDAFASNVAKFVRANHLQVTEGEEAIHWLKTTKPNSLSKTLPVKPAYMQ